MEDKKHDNELNPLSDKKNRASFKRPLPEMNLDPSIFSRNVHNVIDFIDLPTLNINIRPSDLFDTKFFETMSSLSEAFVEQASASIALVVDDEFKKLLSATNYLPENFFEDIKKELEKETLFERIPWNILDPFITEKIKTPEDIVKYFEKNHSWIKNLEEKIQNWSNLPKISDLKFDVQIFKEAFQAIKTRNYKVSQLSLAALSERISEVHISNLDKAFHSEIKNKENFNDKDIDRLDKRFIKSLGEEFQSVYYSLITVFIYTGKLEEFYSDTRITPSRHGSLHHPERYLSPYNAYAFLAIVSNALDKLITE